MASGLEPAFAPGRPVWPLAGMALGNFERDDPDLAIPHGALQNGIREVPERHFSEEYDSPITHTPTEPLGPRPVKTLDLQRKWKLALIASFVFHAAVALFFIQAADDAVLMEGAEFSGIAFLGEGADQVKAGDVSENDDPAVEVTMITMVEAKPVETIEAEMVPVEEMVKTEVAEAVTTDVETLEPVKEMPAEQVNEAKAEPVQPTERAEPQAAKPQTIAPTERTEPETAESKPAPVASETVPEVLATDRIELVEDDNLVQKPVEPQAAQPVEAVEMTQLETSQTSETSKAEPVESAKAEPTKSAKVETTEIAEAEPTETVKAEPTETKPVETAEPAPEAKPAPTPVEKKAASAKPEKQSAPERRTAKQKKAEEDRKVAEKTDAKAKKSGDGGQNQTNARRGQADGQEKGDSKQASRGGSKNGEVGNAAASNYPGKVRSKLARVARSVRAKGRGEVVVAFAVGSNGSVRSARVTRSSGVASVDQAALQAIRKASPFPPIPVGAGRSSWDFSIPLAFMR